LIGMRMPSVKTSRPERQVLGRLPLLA
jgi:hypothetical protein